MVGGVEFDGRLSGRTLGEGAMNVETRVVSNNERAFLLAAVAEGLRVDGRRDVDQVRPMRPGSGGSNSHVLWLGARSAT